jgi:hypothetical protein
MHMHMQMRSDSIFTWYMLGEIDIYSTLNSLVLLYGSVFTFSSFLFYNLLKKRHKHNKENKVFLLVELRIVIQRDS